MAVQKEIWQRTIVEGLFADDSIEIPRLNERTYDLLIRKASDDFDWSQISPTIFGAVFESTLNPDTRRSGGMHYTSIENIHKVIDPLFLDDLKAELDEILANKKIKVGFVSLGCPKNQLDTEVMLHKLQMIFGCILEISETSVPSVEQIYCRSIEQRCIIHIQITSIKIFLNSSLKIVVYQL